MPNHLTKKELEIIRQGTRQDGSEPKTSTMVKNMLLFALFFIIMVVFGYLMVYFGSKA